MMNKHESDSLVCCSSMLSCRKFKCNESSSCVSDTLYTPRSLHHRVLHLFLGSLKRFHMTRCTIPETEPLWCGRNLRNDGFLWVPVMLLVPSVKLYLLEKSQMYTASRKRSLSLNHCRNSQCQLFWAATSVRVRTRLSSVVVQEGIEAVMGLFTEL